MIVGVGGGRVASGVRLDPFDTVLDQLTHRGTGFVGTVVQGHVPCGADLAGVGVPVHQAADPADFPATGRQSRARGQVILDGLLEGVTHR